MTQARSQHFNRPTHEFRNDSTAQNSYFFVKKVVANLLLLYFFSPYTVLSNYYESQGHEVMAIS